MRKLLQIVSCGLLLLLPLLGHSQGNRIAGRVVDAKTKEPIAFASIGLLKGGEWKTDEKGYFQLRGLNKFEQDSLVLMKLGYGRRAVFVENGKTTNLIIELNPQPVIRTDNCLGRPYVVDSESLRISKNEVIYGLPGTQYAFFIENDKRSKTRKMRSASFYIGENGLPMMPFRIRFYQAEDKNRILAIELLAERIVLVPNKSGQWFTVDLSQYKIAVPKKGYFVALEFEKAANYTPQPNLDNYFPSSQIMRPPFDFKKSSLWSYSSENGWRLLPQTNTSRRYNAMVKIEVEAAD